MHAFFNNLNNSNTPDRSCNFYIRFILRCGNKIQISRALFLQKINLLIQHIGLAIEYNIMQRKLRLIKLRLAYSTYWNVQYKYVFIISLP